MEQADDPGEARTAAGLCDRCRHSQPIVTRRGSAFLLCERSRTDRRYPRYPRLPVVRCDGFEPDRPPDA